MTIAPFWDDLNTHQADGHCCIVCNADFRLAGIPAVPVGFACTTRSQVFACEPACARAVGYVPPAGEQLALGAVCGPGCNSPVDGVHTSCPGPLVGRTVVSTR